MINDDGVGSGGKSGNYLSYYGVKKTNMIFHWFVCFMIFIIRENMLAYKIIMHPVSPIHHHQHIKASYHILQC